MRMLAKTFRDLDLYPVVDHRHMKMIDANYSVRVGYWASRNNVRIQSLCHSEADV
jgi:hypothetical protein